MSRYTKLYTYHITTCSFVHSSNKHLCWWSRWHKWQTQAQRGCLGFEMCIWNRHPLREEWGNKTGQGLKRGCGMGCSLARPYRGELCGVYCPSECPALGQNLQDFTPTPWCLLGGCPWQGITLRLLARGCLAVYLPHSRSWARKSSSKEELAAPLCVSHGWLRSKKSNV